LLEELEETTASQAASQIEDVEALHTAQLAEKDAARVVVVAELEAAWQRRLASKITEDEAFHAAQLDEVQKHLLTQVATRDAELRRMRQEIGESVEARRGKIKAAKLARALFVTNLETSQSLTAARLLHSWRGAALHADVQRCIASSALEYSTQRVELVRALEDSMRLQALLAEARENTEAAREGERSWQDRAEQAEEEMAAVRSTCPMEAFAQQTPDRSTAALEEPTTPRSLHRARKEAERAARREMEIMRVSQEQSQQGPGSERRKITAGFGSGVSRSLFPTAECNANAVEPQPPKPTRTPRGTRRAPPPMIDLSGNALSAREVMSLAYGEGFEETCLSPTSPVTA